MKYISTSDIHLGHKNTPTEHIIASFTKTILTTSNADIAVLFIAGDLFDHLLYLNTTEAQKVIQFFHHLLNYCHHNDIQLRVLEGTPSHDWYQSAMLTKINDVRKNKVDLLYFRVLDIEYNHRHNKHILYIPDEWCSNQEDLDLQIQQKLKEHAITKVDISILHGAFKFQTQGHPTSSFLYEENYFLNLTRGFIHIGHYHNHSSLDRILANGSLDRLAHGEEDPKGYIRVQDTSYTFITNPYAYTYKTINVTPATDLAKLDKQVRKTPKGSHIRLLVSDSHPISQSFKDVKLRYPDHYLKKLSKDKATDSNSVTHILTDDLIELSDNLITQANIHQTLLTLVTTKHQLSYQELTKLNHYAEIFRLTTIPPTNEEPTTH